MAWVLLTEPSALNLSEAWLLDRDHSWSKRPKRDSCADTAATMHQRVCTESAFGAQTKSTQCGCYTHTCTNIHRFSPAFLRMLGKQAMICTSAVHGRQASRKDVHNPRVSLSEPESTPNAPDSKSCRTVKPCFGHGASGLVVYTATASNHAEFKLRAVLPVQA